MKQRILWILCSGLLLFIGLTEKPFGEESKVAYSEGKPTRLLDGAWYVHGVSKDKNLAYLMRHSILLARGPFVEFKNPFNYISRFPPQKVKIFEPSSMTLREGKILYRESGDVVEKFSFMVIGPDVGIYPYLNAWDGSFSQHGQRLARIHKGIEIWILDKFTREDRVYEYINPRPMIRPGPEGGDSATAFYAYQSLLMNEGFYEEGSRRPVWLHSVVGWISEKEILYLSNRTTDIKKAWLEKDQDWLKKIRWSLWGINITDTSEQLIWDSKDLGDRVENVKIIPNLRLLVETTENYYVVDGKGKIGVKLSKEDWELPSFVRDPSLSPGGTLSVSRDGGLLIFKKKEREELWVVRTNGGGKMKIPPFPVPLNTCYPSDYHFSFSPDASRLAYFTNIQDEATLVVMEVKDPPSIRLYRLDDPEDALEGLDATRTCRIISWIGNGTLVLPAIKKKDRHKSRNPEEYSKYQSSWLLKLKQEELP